MDPREVLKQAMERALRKPGAKWTPETGWTNDPIPTRCQHIQCRVRADRQDLQCTRRIGHGGRHLHTIALGYCNQRFADLVGPGSGGRKGGHAVPVLY